MKTPTSTNAPKIVSGDELCSTCKRMGFSTTLDGSSSCGRSVCEECGINSDGTVNTDMLEKHTNRINAKIIEIKNRLESAKRFRGTLENVRLGVTKVVYQQNSL